MSRTPPSNAPFFFFFVLFFCKADTVSSNKMITLVLAVLLAPGLGFANVSADYECMCTVSDISRKNTL